MRLTFAAQAFSCRKSYLTESEHTLEYFRRSVRNRPRPKCGVATPSGASHFGRTLLGEIIMSEAPSASLRPRVNEILGAARKLRQDMTKDYRGFQGEKRIAESAIALSVALKAVPEGEGEDEALPAQVLKGLVPLRRFFHSWIDRNKWHDVIGLNGAALLVGKEHAWQEECRRPYFGATRTLARGYAERGEDAPDSEQLAFDARGAEAESIPATLTFEEARRRRGELWNDYANRTFLGDAPPALTNDESNRLSQAIDDLVRAIDYLPNEPASPASVAVREASRQEGLAAIEALEARLAASMAVHEAARVKMEPLGFTPIETLDDLEVLARTIGIPRQEMAGLPYKDLYIDALAFRQRLKVENRIDAEAVKLAAPEATPLTTPEEDAFADLRRFARDSLIGQGRAVVEALCDAGGSVPIVDLAIRDGIKWGDPFQGFKDCQRRLKPKLKARCWRLTRQGNAARLVHGSR